MRELVLFVFVVVSMCLVTWAHETDMVRQADETGIIKPLFHPNIVVQK